MYLCWRLQTIFCYSKSIKIQTPESTVFSVVMLSSLKTARYFGDIYRLHLQDQRVRQKGNRQEQAQLVDCFLLGLLIVLEDGRDMFLWRVVLFAIYTAPQPRRTYSRSWAEAGFCRGGGGGREILWGEEATIFSKGAAKLPGRRSRKICLQTYA
jgi:hypothetical protein